MWQLYKLIVDRNNYMIECAESIIKVYERKCLITMQYFFAIFNRISSKI